MLSQRWPHDARYISGSNEPLRRYGHSRILGHMEPPFWGKGRLYGVSDGTIRFVVSYRLSIATVALSVSATICDRMSLTLKSTGGGSLWAKISGCSPWSRPRIFGSAENEHPRLTNGEIISEGFQPVWSQSTNVTDRQTDGQTTCDRNTAICTKVHRAVKTAGDRDSFQRTTGGNGELEMLFNNNRKYYRYSLLWSIWYGRLS